MPHGSSPSNSRASGTLGARPAGLRRSRLRGRLTLEQFWVRGLSDKVNPNKMHRKPTKIFRELYPQRHCSNREGERSQKMKNSSPGRGNYPADAYAAFHGKERMTQRVEPRKGKIVTARLRVLIRERPACAKWGKVVATS